MHPCTRCKPCNTIYKRINEAKNSMRGVTIEAWDKLEKYKKAEFMMSARHWRGHYLRSQLQQFIEQDAKSAAIYFSLWHLR